MEASVVLPADICESETGKKIILVQKLKRRKQLFQLCKEVDYYCKVCSACKKAQFFYHSAQI